MHFYICVGCYNSVHVRGSGLTHKGVVTAIDDVMVITGSALDSSRAVKKQPSPDGIGYCWKSRLSSRSESTQEERASKKQLLLHGNQRRCQPHDCPTPAYLGCDVRLLFLFSSCVSLFTARCSLSVSQSMWTSLCCKRSLPTPVVVRFFAQSLQRDFTSETIFTTLVVLDKFDKRNPDMLSC